MIKRRHGIVVLLIVAAILGFGIPRPGSSKRFSVNGRTYLLGSPGTVLDAHFHEVADGGARIIDYDARTVERHLFGGTTDRFQSLHPSELREIADAARGAIQAIERRSYVKSVSDRTGARILRAFLADVDQHR